jgi:hypothetical protein
MKELHIFYKNEKIINLHCDHHTLLCVDVNIVVWLQLAKIIFYNEIV